MAVMASCTSLGLLKLESCLPSSSSPSSSLKSSFPSGQKLTNSFSKLQNKQQKGRGIVAISGSVLGFGEKNWESSMPTSGSGGMMMQRSTEADVMSLLLRQRIVFLGSQMDDYVADAIVSQLLLLDAQDPNKEIRLFVNCAGGSISAAMAIYDAIQLCRAEVSTIAFGISASTATVVLAGGSKGRRLAMPNARIMMHQPLGGASGQAIDVEIQAKEIMYHKKNITSILAQITNKSYEQVEKDIDRDRYMSPVEAMEYGIIDGVIDKDTVIPLLPVPERVKSKPGLLTADRSFLIPIIPDDEIY